MPDQRLDALLETWFEDLQCGRTRTIAELCHACPELVSEVEQRIAILKRFELLADAENRDTQSVCADLETIRSRHSQPAATVDDPLPERFGDFVPVRCLGQGGMGTVYLADDQKLRRQVAIKVMRPNLAADATARQRFLREGRAMAAVEHDHIMTIYAVGEERETPFLVMPVLKGETLQVRMQPPGPLPMIEACRIAREIASGLAAAHAVGLVHRDIKPGNIWLEGARGKVKILDFGLARVIEDQDITQSSSVLGTPAYMSPEQGAGVSAIPRSDLFSLGAVIYQMITGKQPFAGENLMTTLSNLANREPEPPHLLNPGVPMELSRLIVAMLSKDPGKRPESAAVVVGVLEQLETKLQAASSVPAAVVAPDSGHVKPPNARTRWLWGGLAGAALVLAIVVIITIERKDGTKSTFKVSNAEQVTLETAPGDKVTISESQSPEPSNSKKADAPRKSGPPVATSGIREPAWQLPAPIPVGESPYDKLDPAAIPATERFSYQPKELVGVIGRHSQRHWGFCVGTAISPNGKLAATLAASWNDGLIIWDLETQTPKWILPRNGQYGGSLAFGGDSSRLYICSEGVLDVLDLTGPEPAHTQHLLVDVNGAKNGALQYIEFCEDGKTLVAHGWSDRVVLFDFSTGKPVWSESQPINAGGSVIAAIANRCFYRMPDGLRAVSIQNAHFVNDQPVGIKLVQTAGGLGVRSDGQRLIVNEKDHVELWDLSQSPPSMLTKAVDYDLVQAERFQFSPDGRYVLGEFQGRSRLFRIDDRSITPTAEISYGLGVSPPAAFSGDSRRLVAGCSEGFVRFWDLSTDIPRELSPFDYSTAIAGNKWNVSPTPSNSGSEIMFYPYPAKYGHFPAQLWGFNNTSPAVVGGPIDLQALGQLHSLTKRRWLQIPFENGRLTKVFEPSGNEWSAMAEPFANVAATAAPVFGAVSATGRIAVLEIDAFGPRPRLQGWNVADGPQRNWEIELENRFAAPQGKEVWISSNGGRIAVLKQAAEPNGLELALWRGADSAQPQPAGIIPLKTPVGQYRAAMSPDGMTLAHLKRSWVDEIVLEDLHSDEPRELAKMTDELNDHHFSNLAFSPDGRYLAYSFVRGVGVIDVAKRWIVWEYAQSPGEVDWVAWAPDGRHILIHNANKTVYVLRLTNKLPTSDKPAT